jgi:hypothetical protein
MNDEQINIAIAEACGWTDISQYTQAVDGWYGYEPENGPHSQIHDYCNDLNAMHEAENKLTPFQRIKHGHFLQEILNEAVVGFVSNYESELKSLSRVASATARQRAEILLRTLGKWEETK